MSTWRLHCIQAPQSPHPPFYAPASQPIHTSIESQWVTYGHDLWLFALNAIIAQLSNMGKTDDHQTSDRIPTVLNFTASKMDNHQTLYCIPSAKLVGKQQRNPPSWPLNARQTSRTRYVARCSSECREGNGQRKFRNDQTVLSPTLSMIFAPYLQASQALQTQPLNSSLVYLLPRGRQAPWPHRLLLHQGNSSPCRPLAFRAGSPSRGFAHPFCLKDSLKQTSIPFLS